MPVVFYIAGKDLRERFRDRSVIVIGFIAPLVIAGVMSLAFRGTDEFRVTAGIVDRDGGQIAGAFADALESPELRDLITVKPFETEAAARDAVDDGDVDAAFVIPAGFSAAAEGGEPVPVEVLTSIDTELEGSVAEAIAAGFVSQINAVRLSVVGAIDAGAPAADAPELAERAAARAPSLIVADRPIGSRPLKAISYFAPAMAIFFLFFAIGFTARSFFSERLEGTLDRIAAAPVAASSLLVGKVLATVVYGTASLATMWVLTSLVFGADWGPAYAVLAVGAAVIFAVAALTAFVVTVSRTERQAEGISSMVVFTLALLGGNFVFVSAAPEVMRRLALLTPNGWALRGFTDFSTGAATAANVVTPVLAIVAFGMVVGVVALLLGRRMLAR